MPKKKLLFVFALILLYISCGPVTVEDHQKLFESNMGQLDEISNKYPNFRLACETIRKDAKQQMESAKQLAEENSKIAGMAAANNIAAPEWVVNLSTIDFQFDYIREMIATASKNSKDKEFNNAVQKASLNGEETIKNAQKKLANANIKNPSDAAEVVGSVMIKLESAVNELSGLIETIEKDTLPTLNKTAPDTGKTVIEGGTQ
jgi:hypothetical protein